MNLTPDRRGSEVLSISELDATEADLEPISPAVLRASLEALKLAASIPLVGGDFQIGKAMGSCQAAAAFLEHELRRVGVVA